MVNEAIAPDLSVLILLKENVDAEILFECVDELLNLILLFLIKWFSFDVKYFLYIRIA